MAAGKHVDCDVAIIGAGVAGLAAAGVLARAGRSVRCIEARDRVGGRILTVHDPLSPLAIEMGAEFVHGRPPEIWNLIRNAGLLAYEHTATAIHFDHGKVLKEKQVGEVADKVLTKMAKSRRKNDESFEDYLRHSRQSSRAASWARVQIEGFNAAHRDLISAASLAEDAAAAEKIEGGHIFRIPGGYDNIVMSLLRTIPDYQSAVQLNSVVRHVKWRRGFAEVSYKPGRITNHKAEAGLTCRQLIVTLPIGVLKSRAVAFDPPPRAILKAAAALESGHVFRVTFRFTDAFWEENEDLRQAGFLISNQTAFMSWWTTHPVISPILTGWSAGTSAEQFQGLNPDRIASEALKSLAQILHRKIPRPEAFYFHDWQADAFSRGAYSYVPVGGTRHALTAPVNQTLFFAGEAANQHGNGATVHGAIESGIHAAQRILEGQNP